MPGLLTRYRSLSLSRRFAILFVGILLLAFGNALMVGSLLTNLKGTAEIVNVSGSLRWRIQSIQTKTLRFAAAQKAGTEFLDASVSDFKQTLDLLGQLVRRNEARNAWMPIQSSNLQYLIASLNSEFERFSGMIQNLPSVRTNPPVYLLSLETVVEDSNRIFSQADAITRAATELADRNVETVSMTVYGLVVVDFVLMLVALYGVRVNLVKPLREISRMSQCIADGDYGGMRLSSRPPDEIGRLVGTVNHMADTIEASLKTIAEDVDRLRQQELILKRLSWAAEHSPADITICDREGRILYVNPRFTDMTGYTSEEVVGRTPRLLKSDETPSETHRRLWETILSGSEWSGEFLNRKKDGTLYWASCLIAPVKDDKGEITNFMAVREDITARKQAQQEMLNINAMLEQRVEERTAELSAANSDLESFSYSVSHDLRAPLRIIAGLSGLMVQGCSGCVNGESLGHLRGIGEASQRMNQLIEGLLRLSHIGHGTTDGEVIDLSQMANAILDDLRKISPGREVWTSIQERVFAIGDPVLLRAVLENLLGNAWKFTRHREGAQIELRSWEDDGETIVCVKDNGAGFDPKYGDKLFRPFQRLHRESEFEGTGIGLATVKRIIIRHKGRIWAEAVPNHGATFYFAIPKEAT